MVALVLCCNRQASRGDPVTTGGGYWIASKSDVSDFDNLMPKSGRPDFGSSRAMTCWDVRRGKRPTTTESEGRISEVFENHLRRPFPLEDRGLGWVSPKQRTLNRDSRAMSRGL